MNLIRVTMLVSLLAGLAAPGARAGTDTGEGARALMGAGLEHELHGRHQEAIEDFTKAIGSGALSQSDRARAAFDRGVAQDALGRTGAAISDYSLAIRLDGAFAPAFNNRANAFRRIGRLGEAKRDYLRALSRNNAAREYSYFGLGKLAEAEGDKAAARDYYKRSIGINPTYAPASQSLAALTLPPPVPKPVALAPPRQSAPAPAPKLPPVAAPVLRRAILDTKAKPAPAANLVQVQLGAFRDDKTAQQGWNEIAAAAGEALKGLSPIVVTADLPGKGRFWRLRTAVADKAQARKLCAALAVIGRDCLIVKD